MKKIYLITVVLLATFVTACKKDNVESDKNDDGNTTTSVDGVWRFDSQEWIFEGTSQGKTEDPKQLECLKKNEIIFQDKECNYKKHTLMNNGCIKQETKGNYKLTDKTLEITVGNSVKKIEIVKKTDKEIIIKDENSSDPGNYYLDTYVKK